MTTDGLVGELPARPSTAEALLLDRCDSALGEICRRSHLFGWLRRPGAEEWIPVDGYYPGNRLVVMARDPDGAEDQLIADRTREHGLRLLWLAPDDLPSDPIAVRSVIARAFADLGPAPPRPTGAPATERGSTVAQAVTALAPPPASALLARPERRPGPQQAEAAARAARFVASHHQETERAARAAAAARSRVPIQRTRPSGEELVSAQRRRQRRKRAAAPSRRRALLGPIVAIALIAAVAAEAYFGIARWALDGGHVLLAFGIGLDTCARVLGTIAAGRAGDRPVSWAAAVCGSPFVAAFALGGPDGLLDVDPAPLAGLLGLCALGVLAITAVVAVLGG